MHIASTPTLVHISSVIHSTSSLLLYVRSLHHFDKNIPHTSFPRYTTQHVAHTINASYKSVSPAYQHRQHHVHIRIKSTAVSLRNRYHPGIRITSTQLFLHIHITSATTHIHIRNAITSASSTSSASCPLPRHVYNATTASLLLNRVTARSASLPQHPNALHAQLHVTSA